MILKKYCLLLIPIILTFSCGDDESPTPPIEDDRIVTTLEMALIHLGVGDTTFLFYQDLDGPGNDAPIIQGATLDTNAVYFGELTILNESASPIENTTDEIINNPGNFQIFYTSNSLNLTFTYADQDSDSNPIGLSMAINTGETSTGNLTINVQEALDKSAPGVAEGNAGNSTGKTAIQVNIPITIE